MLSNKQKKDYITKGYTVFKNFKSKQACEALRDAASQIISEFDPQSHRSIFATNNEQQSRDDYFLTSGDKVRCFFEDGAFDKKGALKQDKSLSINKIGHAMHDLIPAFDSFSRDPKCADILADIGIEDPKIWQSMYIFKQPRIGGEVRWHQDATYFYTDPISVTTFWFAIDDATLDNGCLWVDTKGADTPLREVFRVEQGQSRIESLSNAPWPTSKDAIPLEVESGTLVVFHGLLPHYSAPNTSSKARHAYTLHVTDGRANYPATNWIQRNSDFPVRGFEKM